MIFGSWEVMVRIDEQRLRHRRQFLLSREIIPSLSHWNRRCLSNCYHLYSHPDLSVSYREQDGVGIVLLGYIFDSINYGKTDEEIVEDILKRSRTFESFLEAIKPYSGRYIFLYLIQETFYVMHDPLGLREIYYCTSMNRIICGSQPNLIRQYSNPNIDVSQNHRICRFFEYDRKKVRSGRFWIGDETYFEGIKHLLPNHYLDVSDLKAKRYWPTKELATIDLHEAVERSCAFLRGMLKAASIRYELMMAVTGGTDSRTLLAASKEIKEKIYYFINRHKNLNDKHPDIYIPTAIFNRIKVPFHLHSVEGEIDQGFRQIFLDNTFLSNDFNLPAIYNIYFKHHGNRLNILGVGEIGRTFFGHEPKNLDGFYLARLLKIKDSPYAVEQCQKWLEAARPYARKCKVNILTLLLWEQLLGNWGVVGNSESDIAIEEFDPFNSHYLYEMMLGVDLKYSKYGGNLIFQEIIKSLWPVLLEFPINPPYEKTDKLKRVLEKLGVLSLVKSIIYKCDRLRFRLKYYQK